MIRYTPLALVILVAYAAADMDMKKCNGQMTSNVYGKMINGTCYAFVTSIKVDYDIAEMVCEKRGGTLALVKTSEINTALADLLNSKVNSSERFWIGLNDKQIEGVYRWEDGSKMSFHNFENDQGVLSVLGQPSEDCVAMDASGGWYAYKCGDEYDEAFAVVKNFICEFSRSGQSTRDPRGTTQGYSGRSRRPTSGHKRSTRRTTGGRKKFTGEPTGEHKRFTGKPTGEQKRFTGKPTGEHKRFTGKPTGEHKKFTGKPTGDHKRSTGSGDHERHNGRTTEGYFNHTRDSTDGHFNFTRTVDGHRDNHTREREDEFAINL